jgi:glutamate-5-semialdehyde dehydrogenase
VAPGFLPEVQRALEGVELVGDSRTRAILADVAEASEEDFGTEFLGLKLSIAVVDDVQGAIEHIARFGSGHSEAIITDDVATAERFVREVDAAAVLVNASTRFIDGGELGLGAEVGISTQKLHARGPMGLRELTCVKWVVRGEGQVRQ